MNLCDRRSIMGHAPLHTRTMTRLIRLDTTKGRLTPVSMTTERAQSFVQQCNAVN